MDRVRWQIALATAAYMAGFGAWAMVQGNYEFLLYALVLASLIAFIVYVDRCVRFSPGVLWALAAAGLLHMAGGNIPIDPNGQSHGAVLYDLWIIPGVIRYDQIVHATSCAVAAFGVWQMIVAMAGRPLTMSPVGAVVVACTAMGLGSVNEVIEFATTKVIAETNVGDYENNAFDLVFNSLGACLATAIIWIRHRPGRHRACSATHAPPTLDTIPAEDMRSTSRQARRSAVADPVARNGRR